MTAPIAALVLASETGVPYNSLLARLAVPLGILVFLGGPYLLLRSNLGTRRAYLVLATSFFGLMIIFSLFWWWGAPGTPRFTGPTNLPGQPADEYRPTWVSFAEDSVVAQTEPYASLLADPGAFGPVPEAAPDVEEGVSVTQTFFSSAAAGQRVQETWEVAEGPEYAVAENGQPVIRVTFADPENSDSTFTAYAFFDAGSPAFPSIVFLLLSVAGFAVHALMLHADEQRERRESQQVATEEAERVPVDA